MLKYTDFDFWNDAIENMKKDRQDRIQRLIDRYGWPLIENKMNFEDSIEFDFIKPFLNDMSGQYKVAENTSSLSQSDAQYTAKEDFSDERLLRETIERLKTPDFEGYVPHIYLDINGKITTGIGALVDNEATFMNIDWLVNNERPATAAEKKAAYNSFLDLKKLKEYGNQYGADYYENKSNLRVPEEYANKRAYTHLQNDLRRLREGIVGFDDLHYPTKEVLLDLRYTSGAITETRWPKLREGIREKNLTKIYNNVNRKDVQPSRNQWAKDRIKSIPAGNGWHW